VGCRAGAIDRLRCGEPASSAAISNSSFVNVRITCPLTGRQKKASRFTSCKIWAKAKGRRRTLIFAPPRMYSAVHGR